MGLIECKGISKRFGEKVALDNLSVDIPKGKIFGLLGPNGAGKTTLIRIINRITIPNSGEVYDPNTKTWSSGGGVDFEAYALAYMAAGADAVGGCCTTTGKHIRQVVSARSRFLGNDPQENG